MRAIELNAVAIENNKAAFEWGRRPRSDPAAVQKLRAAGPGHRVQEARHGREPGRAPRRVPDRLPERGLRRAVPGLRRQGAAGRSGAVGKTSLTEAVARYLFKLMAYKDEYEVARLHTDRGFLDRVEGMFEGDFKLNYHLAPPIIAEEERQGRTAEAEVRPGHADRLPAAGQAQGPARHGARHLRPHRGAQDRARADRRIPRQHRRGAGRPERRQPRHGAGDRQPARADPRLRPRQGAQPGGGAHALGRAAGQVAQSATARSAPRPESPAGGRNARRLAPD